jgi:hypothetical protein
MSSLAVLRPAPAARPSQQLLRRVLDYYAPDGDRPGSSFLDGTECEHPYAVVAGDLYAVTMLGLRVGPAAGRRLLGETPEATRIGGQLAALPLDLTLAEADAATLDAMAGLHAAVLAAVDPRSIADAGSAVVATAVCARKRPELFPVLDAGFCGALGLPGAAAAPQSWAALRHLLADGSAGAAVDAVYAAAHRAAPDLELDIYPLRRLQVLAELAGPILGGVPAGW